jgi:hypothetical protein
MRSRCFLFLSIGIVPLTIVHAADLSGTWQYEKGEEYFGQLKTVPPPQNTILQIANGQLALSAKCIVTLEPKKYNYPDAFQSLAKEDVEEQALDKYLSKNFSFSPLKTAAYYQPGKQATDCNKPLRDFFVTENKLLVPFAGSAFYSFVRSDGNAGKAASSAPQLYGHKLSHLPFSMTSYANICLATLPLSKGIPKTTDKCAPVYAPQIASPNGDALTLLIGTHDYKQGGARHADDYVNPFANKLHPTFVVLPPLKDVVLVRVDDLEPGLGEKRDTMSGAFLAIKNGKVSDQLNQGCFITTDYVCRDDDGKPQYQLMETGKFKKLN